jgi:hypothetical protein
MNELMALLYFLLPRLFGSARDYEELKVHLARAQKRFPPSLALKHALVVAPSIKFEQDADGVDALPLHLLVQVGPARERLHIANEADRHSIPAATTQI